MTNKRKICFRITAESLSKYLFNSKVKVAHVEFCHDTDMIKIFLEGAGPLVAEGQNVSHHNIQQALREIREACQKTQD